MKIKILQYQNETKTNTDKIYDDIFSSVLHKASTGNLPKSQLFYDIYQINYNTTKITKVYRYFNLINLQSSLNLLG